MDNIDALGAEPGMPGAEPGMPGTTPAAGAGTGALSPIGSAAGAQAAPVA